MIFLLYTYIIFLIFLNTYVTCYISFDRFSRAEFINNHGLLLFHFYNEIIYLKVGYFFEKLSFRVRDNNKNKDNKNNTV